MTNHKVVALRNKFENFKAFAAHIAEDESIVGFTGCVVWIDSEGHRSMKEITFKVTVAEVAYASVILAAAALVT